VFDGILGVLATIEALKVVNLSRKQPVERTTGFEPATLTLAR